MTIPPDLRRIVHALAKKGRPYLVGGCVRDSVLGLAPKDFDVEVFGMDWNALGETLAPFGPTDVVGNHFGVIKVRVNASEYDISLPRRERKTGEGHRGFSVEPDPNISLREASARRDFTINALMFDLIAGEIVDHHNGVADLNDRILRHTSPAFGEDPLRVLRAFQFAARFDLTLAPETATLCQQMVDTLDQLPRERVWGEWHKFATQAIRPSLGLAVLKETGWLKHFPELAALDGLSQEPEWHPEGDVFTHTGHCLDALISLPGYVNADLKTRETLSFAVLCHDLGKATTTERAEKQGVERWTSPGHDRAGGPLTETFLERLGSPIELRERVRNLVLSHHAHQSWPFEGPTDATVRRLARKLEPATIEELTIVMEADHQGRPPLLSEKTQIRIDRLRESARRLAVETKPPAAILLGRDLIALGKPPGPAFGPTLQAAFEAQLDGEFSNHEEGMTWLRRHVDSGKTVTGETNP